MVKVYRSEWTGEKPDEYVDEYPNAEAVVVDPVNNYLNVGVWETDDDEEETMQAEAIYTAFIKVVVEKNEKENKINGI